MDQNQLNFFEDRDPQYQMKASMQSFDRKESQLSVSQQLFPDLSCYSKEQSDAQHEELDKEDSESVDVELQKILIFRKNVQKYPYAQGHHYYCDLDHFQRDPDSVSYVRNALNKIKMTYSKDNMSIGGSKIKDIINRIYFTLPKKQESADRKPSKAKNSSHQALFATQDKKLGLDRSIVTIRQILNNLEQIVYTQKIEQYSILKRDQFLHKILDSSVSISQKRMILISRLEGLLETRRHCEQQWIAQQTINFSPSCNQKFYQEYKVKLYSLSKNILVPFIYSNHYYLKELIQSPKKDNIFNFIKKVFTFSREQTLSVSPQTLLKLSVDFMPKIITKINDNSAVIFPIHIFSFGNGKVMNIVNYILARRLLFYKNQFYTMNLLVRKMFNIHLDMPEDYDIDDQTTYKLQASGFIQKIRKFSKKSSNTGSGSQTTLIDDQINYEDLQSPRKSVFVLKRRYSVQLTGMQYIILMLYHWLCLIVKQLDPFIDQNPSFLEIISSPNYGLINLSVSQAFKSTLISTLNFCIQQIRENLYPSQEINFDNFRIEFDYNQMKGIGVLWRIQNQAQEIQSSIDQDIENYKNQKKDQQRQQDYDILYFGKRVKSLQGQWV